MKKIILLFIVLFSIIPVTFSSSWEMDNIIIPKELNFTERYFISELKDLSVKQETMKREIFREVQDRQLQSVDKALSYSANTVNFLFILFTVIAMLLWIVWWKSFSDIKKSFRGSMEKEMKKIIGDFEKKITSLEQEQKVNILWRQYNLSENNNEKLDILNKIYKIRPTSKTIDIEKSNIYLSMWLYEKVVDTCDLIMSSKRSELYPQAYFNRASAYNQLWKKENAISDLVYLLQLSPEYKWTIEKSEKLFSLLGDPRVKKVVK